MAISKDAIKRALKKSGIAHKPKNTLEASQPQVLTQSEKATPASIDLPPGDDERQYDNIPVSKQAIAHSPITVNLKALTQEAIQIKDDMEVVLRSQTPLNDSKRRPMLRFNNDVADPVIFYQKKIPLLVSYIESTKHLLKLFESGQATTTEVFDYIDGVLKLDADNYNYNIEANSNAEEGPIIRIFAATIEGCYQLLDDVIVED